MNNGQPSIKKTVMPRILTGVAEMHWMTNYETCTLPCNELQWAFRNIDAG